MDLVDSIPELAAAMTVYMIEHAASLPQVTQQAFAASAVEPFPVRFTNMAEALFAVADQLAEPGLVLGGQLTGYVEANYRLLSTGDEPTRGARMFKAFRRRLGELTEAQAPAAEDPDPRPQYLPAEPVLEV